MKYVPEPVEENGEIKWDLEEIEYIFENQDDAMIASLLLEIRDLLRKKDIK